VLDSWNGLATAGTPEFLNSKAGEILSTSPQHTPSFFYIHRTCGRASTPYRNNFPARDSYAPAQRTGWMAGAVQNTCGQPRVFNTQAKARDTPVALVAGRWILALLASGLGSSVLRGSTFDH
jgi:hypothetical protein